MSSNLGSARALVLRKASYEDTLAAHTTEMLLHWPKQTKQGLDLLKRTRNYIINFTEFNI